MPKNIPQFKTEREKMVYMIRKMARYLYQAYGTDYKYLLSKEAEKTLLNLFDMSQDIVGEDLFKEDEIEITDYTNPGLTLANNAPIKLGDCFISIVSYNNVYDNNLPDHAIHEGTILFTADLRDGTFRIIIFQPKGSKKVNILYLNEGSNCFKYWATCKKEFYDYVQHPDDYGEVRPNDFTKEQLQEIDNILSTHSVASI